MIFAIDKDTIFGKEMPKALVKLCGIPLLERNLHLLRSIGIRDVSIVTGYKGTMIEDYFKDGRDWGLKIEYFQDFNFKMEDISSKGGEKDGDGGFMVLFGSDVFDVRILKELSTRGGMTYCYDSNPEHSDKAVKVLVENDRVRGIGKDLQNWTGVYVGICVLDYGAFPILKDCGDSNWIECLDKITERLEVHPFDISEIPTYVAGLKRSLKPVWFSIGTREDLVRCKRLLIGRSQKGVHFAAYYNKPIEDKVVEYICEYPWITPNRLTIISNAFAYFVTFLFLKGYLLAASTSTFVVSIMDGLDGKLARARGTTTKLGSIEHSFDLLFEQSWWIAFSLAIFFDTGSWLPLGLCLGILLMDTFVRHVYMQFKAVMEIPLTDYARFDRAFAKIDGRRNVYIIYILLGVISGKPLYSLFAILGHATLTAVVYAYRAMKHIHDADKRARLLLQD
ncbi:MAG: CDP-alcohol phosphatidyltransferase family protein [Candidatus Hydrothermarchaeales archaeon]